METKSFLESLFDFSFTEVVTTRIIKILFIVIIVLATLAGLGMIIAAFVKGIWGGLVSLVLVPIVVFIYVLMARIWCELVLVMFRIAENTGHLVDQSKKGNP